MKLERANIPPVRSLRCINNQRREPPRSFTSIGSFVPLYTTPISNHFENFEFRPAAATVIFLSFFCVCVWLLLLYPQLGFHSGIMSLTRLSLFFLYFKWQWWLLAEQREREGLRCYHHRYASCAFLRSTCGFSFSLTESLLLCGTE